MKIMSEKNWLSEQLDDKTQKSAKDSETIGFLEEQVGAHGFKGGVTLKCIHSYSITLYSNTVVLPRYNTKTLYSSIRILH